MEDSIGALWLNESKKGNKYMSGNIEIDGVKHKILIFKNTKTKDEQPDYRIFAQTPRDSTEQKAREIFEDDPPF